MNRLRCYSWLIIILLSGAFSAHGVAQDLALDPTGEMLLTAMRVRVSVSYNRQAGTPIPAAHCRHAKEGCDRRLEQFASYLAQAGKEHGVDPWVLAAMASRESGFNPFAKGSVGELGLLQIHPRSKAARQVRFVHDEQYRKRCRREPGACQREVVDRAARLLASSIERCGGDLYAALGMYNTGRCGGNGAYARRVLRERTRLRRSVGLDAPSRIEQHLADSSS